MATDNPHIAHGSSREPAPPPPAGASVPGPVPVPSPSIRSGGAKPKMTWGRRIEKLVLTLFCLEVGAFLLVFPWMPFWSDNYFFSLLGSWRPVVLSPYFRGAVSGLGAINLYLAILESVAFVGSFLEEPARGTD